MSWMPVRIATTDVQISLINTIYPTNTNIKKIASVNEIEYSIYFPKAASPTSPYELAPVILEHKHNK
mgnify:CR=1 FL=1